MPSKRSQILAMPSSVISGWTTKLKAYSRTKPPSWTRPCGREPLRGSAAHGANPDGAEEIGPRRLARSPFGRHVEEQAVDALVRRELRMEGGGQHVALAHEDGPAVQAGQHLDVGPRTPQLGRADEDAL